MNERSPNSLAKVEATPKTGDERFHFSGADAGFDLLQFWRWSVSDLVSNATRGRLAEYIVARALQVEVQVRAEWDAYDLTTPAGIKVEVKSAAYVQSWFQRKLSPITFSYRTTRSWDAATNLQSVESGRWADVYVFALLHHQTKATIDPMNLDQWEFFVVSTRTLNERTRSQHSIQLKSLLAISKPVKYSSLAKAVADAIMRE